MILRGIVQTTIGGVAAAYVLAVGDAAIAGPSGVAAAFGNTVMARYPDGKYERIWLKADGTWEALGRRGNTSSGHWTLKDDKVCMKQSKPFPFPFSYCTPIPPDGGLGVQWAGHDMHGEPIQLTVVEGIQRP